MNKQMRATIAFTIIFLLLASAPHASSFSINTNFTNATLTAGGEKNYTLYITNELAEGINATAFASDDLWDLVEFRPKTVQIDANSTASVNIRAFANTAGGYNGSLIVTSGGISKSVPVSLVVMQSVGLNMELQIAEAQVEPGKDLTAGISLQNSGGEPINVNLTYIIQNIDTDETLVSYENSTIVENTTEFYENIKVPQNAKPGDYTLEVRAQYGDKTLNSIEGFTVFTTNVSPADIFMRWDSLLALVVISVCAFVFGTWLLDVVTEMRKKRVRYPMASKYENLPKGALQLGKIAETRTKASFDVKDLVTHVLIAGSTGTGKSMAAMVIAGEALRHNIPVVVCDPTAQWTGFLSPCRDRAILKIYSKFGMKKEDATGFRGEIFDNINRIDFSKYMRPGEITVLDISKSGRRYEDSVSHVMESILKTRWEESVGADPIRLLIVFEEVHRLLPRYGAPAECYLLLERASRELRMYGIGMIMTSQLLSDFSEDIRNNILTEIQMHTKSFADIDRVQQKYGRTYAHILPKMEVGVGMMQNPKYNGGRPFFVSFHPTLHDPHKLKDAELRNYRTLNEKIKKIEDALDEMKKKKQSIISLETELELAKDKLRSCRFEMAKMQIGAIEKRLRIK